jgi:LPS-assembly protein
LELLEPQCFLNNSTSIGKSIKFLIFLFFLSALSAVAAEVDISADNLEYIESSGRINAKGNVVLNWEDKKVYADSVEFIVDKKIMNAYGNVKVEEKGSVIYADNISYNYDDETGDIKETFAYSSMIFMRAKSMQRQGGDTFAIRNIKLSTCDCNDPHTCFKSKRGKLLLNKRITIYNAVFYVGKIPIFYLPIVTKSLKTGKGFGADLKFEVEPGYTNSCGLSLKTAVSCSLSDTVSGKFKYDYLGKKGNGYGAEISYVTDRANGNLYTYTNKNLITNKEIWCIRPNYYHRINHLWSIRSRGIFQSDRDFNNYYNQVNWNRTKEHLESYFSITRQNRIVNLATDVEYIADYDVLIHDYKMSSVKLPNVKLDFFTKKDFMGIYHKPYVEYSHNYSGHKNKKYFYRNTGLFKYTITKDYKISRRVVLKPSLEASENWYDMNELGDYKNDFFTKYGGALNLRFRATSWMDWNANYLYMARTKPNSLDIESLENDYGIEHNHVTLRNDMYIGDRTTVRNDITYNMKHHRLGNPTQWWSTLNTELMWTPTHYITLIAKESQLMEPCKFNSFQFDLKVGELKKAYINFGAFYQNYNDSKISYKSNEIDNLFGFGVWLNPKWRVDYNIRTTSRTNLSYIAMTDHEARLYRDLHCYNFGVRWRITRLDQEIFFIFNLKTNMPIKDKSKENFGYDDPDAMFYPWENEKPIGSS